MLIVQSVVQLSQLSTHRVTRNRC